MIEILTSALILVGVFFAFAASVGLVRFPDVYCRLHAAGLATSLGVPLILFASVVFFSGSSASLSLKGLLAIIFLFLTSPVGTHLIGWSAYRSGVSLYRSKDSNMVPAVSLDDAETVASRPSKRKDALLAIDENG